MAFSYDGNLFLLFYTETDEIYYRVKVKKDFNSHERNNDRSAISELINFSSIGKSEDFTGGYVVNEEIFR